MFLGEAVRFSAQALRASPVRSLLTGLGMAIVGRIIETHRGQIRILSRPGHGTIIRITLPVK